MEIIHAKRTTLLNLIKLYYTQISFTRERQSQVLKRRFFINDRSISLFTSITPELIEQSALKNTSHFLPQSSVSWVRLKSRSPFNLLLWISSIISKDSNTTDNGKFMRIFIFTKSLFLVSLLIASEEFYIVNMRISLHVWKSPS